MDDGKLRALLTAVDCGSFSKAAAQLGYTQSAMTHLVNKLEAEIGCTLLERDSQGIRLTDAGRQLLPYIQNVVCACDTLLQEAAEQSDVVVAVGWQFWDGLTAVVPEMPDTKFIFVDNGLDGVGDNLLSITYAENEGSFLAGYVAMKLAQSGIVGVIGGENSDTINNFVVGYKQGALYANPDGTVLDPVYTDDYEAPDKGKEAALSLYSQGADVVYAVAGKTGLGVFEAAQEQGKYAVGVDSDQKYINPDVIICSMLKRVGDSVYDVISNYLEDGVFDGGTIWNADMSSGLVGLGYGDDTMTQQVSDELKAEVEALAEKIIAGEIEVESTR